MKFLKHITATTILTTSLHCYATVGGGQTIEVLGYETEQQKLYLLRHYEDERGRLPQLYYYQLNSKTPDKLIEVQSLYINPKTHQIDYDQDGIPFEKDLNKIKKRLTPLLVGNINTAKIQVVKSQTHYVPAWHDQSQKIPQYKTIYKVTTASLNSKNQQAVQYAKTIKITQNYVLPNQNKMLVIVKYFGIPEETGYDVEDAVLLLPIQ
ncbi:hypothetical protein [Acinetobacter guillouiae]|uniref:hypothetical protein n=1 Tax=Acinetobacter guillouiae TaxID=106649 RepID=UPI001250045C|nr:hypothetical protein [Acinetobacter guillouiae]